MHWRDRAARTVRRGRATITAHWRSLVIGSALFAIAAIVFRTMHSDAGYWSIDDAGITYAAAFELADHGSLAPYLDGPPIEGYSNPLLFFIVTLLRLLRAFDPITTPLTLETLLFAGMTMLLWRLLRRVTSEVGALIGAVAFAAVELLVPATWIWYRSGLENVWLSAGLVALLWVCVRTAAGVPLRAAWGALAFAVAITRPEAPVYAIAFYAALVGFARPDTLPLRGHLRQLARALAVTSVLYAAFLVWRRLAYHAWLPNTYYAKLGGEIQLADNLRDYIGAQLLGYARSGLFAACLLALLVIRNVEKLALCLLLFVGASLALPLVASPDWMGEHRFATPFFAMCHVCYAALLAACVAQLRLRVAPLATLLCLLALPALLVYDPLLGSPPRLPAVTIATVAHVKGAQRWEQQMRLGLPYAVVLTPDVGGSLLVGAMQSVDNGYLTDFQMARIGRQFDNPRDQLDRRVRDQYQIVERRPDLVDPNPFWPFDRRLLGQQYLSNAGRNAFHARRDLVEVAAVEPDAELVLVHDGVQISVSREMVRTVAPHALIRCEVFVAWTKPDDKLLLRASLGTFDHDELLVAPYDPRASGVERRALLLGVPQMEGPLAISFELLRAGKQLAVGRPLVIQVTNNPFAIQKAVATLGVGASPAQLAQRTAWLREQMIPRLPMHELHDLEFGLFGANAKHEAIAGKHIRRLRWNARLATLQTLPTAVRVAEDVAIRRMFDTCGQQRRVLCLGRVVDELRRLGYRDVLARVPAIARELKEDPPNTALERYEALVGITLAHPADLDRQSEVLEARHALAKAGTLPAL